MRHLCLLVCTLCMLGASSAGAQRVRVAHEGRAGAVDARLGEAVVLTAITRRHLGRVRSVRWFRIVPHLQHRTGRGASTQDNTYANAVLGGPEHGRWVGVDTIEYVRVPFEANAFTEFRGHELVLRGAPAHNERAPNRHSPGAGTLWVSAEVEFADGTTSRSPGIEDVENTGLKRQVMRVSFREGDDLLGWMSAFFGVPYVFGSTPRQSNQRNGTDCADVVVAAAHQMGSRMRYTSVPGLTSRARPRSEVLFQRDGQIQDATGRAVTLRWGEDIQAGDLILIDYSAGQGGRWRHVGALIRDADEGIRGALDGQDWLRHMGRRGLSDDQLTRHRTIRFRVWRLRSR